MNKKKQTEREINKIVIAEADDEKAWIEVLKKRGERGSREKFLAALEKVPTVEADPEDRFE